MDRSTIVLLVALFAAGEAGAADPERGADLYRNHCSECHGSVAHERTARKVRSWESLQEWVGRWSGHLQLGWGAEEREDVATYLDMEFYQLPDSPAR